jgi:hypothetical protein
MARRLRGGVGVRRREAPAPAHTGTSWAQLFVTLRWRGESGTVLREMMAKQKLRGACAVYLGDRALNDGGVLVLPARQFAERLSELLA